MRTSTLEPRRLQARLLAGLLGSGSSLALLGGVLPSGTRFDHHALIGVALAGFAVALVLVQDWRAIPAWTYHALILAATFAVGCAIVAGGLDSTEVGVATLYVWLALYAFHFFTRAVALAHLAVMEAVLAVALGATGIAAAGAVTTMVAVVVAGSGLATGYVTAQLRQAARTDALTGVMNRAGLEDVLGREVARADRFGIPLAVALVDLDDFKDVNDAFGHAAGDRVLREFALRWNASLRATDVFARWGGDEFVAVMPGLALLDAPEVLDRIRSTGGRPCSVGVTTWGPGDGPERLLERADRALYRAKKEPGDRIVALPPEGGRRRRALLTPPGQTGDPACRTATRSRMRVREHDTARLPA